MVKKIVKGKQIFARKAQPATEADRQVVTDLIDTLRANREICVGMAANMGAVLLVAGAEGKRSALTHSRVMIHQPLGGVQGQASDIEIEAKEIQKFKKELYNIISEHSHTPFEKVWQDSDRNYWMTADEAKEYGMIDNVLKRKK